MTTRPKWTRSLKSLTSIATLTRISCGNATSSICKANNLEKVSISVTDLKTKAKVYVFAQLKDSLYLWLNYVWHYLWQDSRPLSQRKWVAALNICRANKATSSQVKSLSDTLESHHDAFAVQKRNSSDKYKHKCDKCGNQHYCHQPCPAQSVECYNCGLRNHFAKVC